MRSSLNQIVANKWKAAALYWVANSLSLPDSVGVIFWLFIIRRVSQLCPADFGVLRLRIGSADAKATHRYRLIL